MQREQLTRLEQLPNVGPAIAKSLRRLGIHTPRQLMGQDPYYMYEQLWELDGKRPDPGVLDVFISTVRFMAGEPGQRCWKYTEERKRELAARRQAANSGIYGPMANEPGREAR